MTEWFVPCNVKMYDIFGAFSEFKRINWGQTTNVQAGDVVYIYLTAPYKSIQFKCRVNKVNLKEEDAVIDDTKYDLTRQGSASYGRYMELEILGKYASSLLSLPRLNVNGLSQVRSTQRINGKLSRYLTRVIGQLVNEMEDADLINEVNQSASSTAKDGFVYRGRKKPKAEPKTRNGQNIWARDTQTALNALAHAKYACEIDAAHPTFIRKNSGKKYTEPHHLVPLSDSDRFDVSLDVEENIVSLCSNCHNQIHYGKDADILLKRLYEDRAGHLKKVGIHISLDELLNMYR